MRCTSPVMLRTYEAIIVPCGRCIACRIQRAQEWATRAMHEAMYHEFSTYATYTYDDDHLSTRASLSRAAFTDLLKRTRLWASPRRLRYFGCGEYGSETGRPHLHILWFGLGGPELESWYDPVLRKTRSSLLERHWQNRGHVVVGEVTYDSARYVASYVDKMPAVPDDWWVGRERPWRGQSQGLGRRYVEDHADELEERRWLSFRGTRHSLPRYYLAGLGGWRGVVEDITRVLCPQYNMEYETERQRRDVDEQSRLSLLASVRGQSVSTYRRSENRTRARGLRVRQERHHG